ncbi:atlastin-2 isoform X1 [Hydra vulgaris]|uniref:Atlastin-2 n=1 Tax=Hydra vulgaris TaxID=6087 RepID=T2M979_HYDVU|nr:atlastin-2 [Hydra vulgaris]
MGENNQQATKDLPKLETNTVERLPPHPVCILKSKDDHTFELDIAALEGILLQKNVRDKQVVVVSVAGAFRKGKSFLLDFFLRYLQKKGADGWIGNDEEELTGFSWRGGAERETTGILLWSEPFFSVLPSGEEVVVLIMDTQGAFDSTSTVKDCATVFALSTMTSSVQVYNISSNIQEDNLQHLQLFTEYGRLALAESSSKPFQRLEFLVRDWSYPYEHPYGNGQSFLDKRISIDNEQHQELKRSRSQITSCFEKLGCFLMPHPGKIVASNPNFKGKLKDIDEDFIEYLSIFVPSLLAPKNLQVKCINGSDVTCRGLLEYFKAYIKVFEGGELPEPKSMLQATAEANNLAALAAAKDQYQRDMEQLCGGDTPYLVPKELDNRSEIYKSKARTLFNATRKMGGDEFSKEYEQRLIQEINELFDGFVKTNDSKNIFNAARTPAVFLVIIVLSYMTSGFFIMLGLTSLASVFNIILGLALLAVVAWAYIRFSGELREIGSQLDDIAEWIWDEVMMKVYAFALEQGTQAVIHRQITSSKKRE